LVAEWIADAGDIAEAYVSSRRSDDAAFYHKIVIVINPADGPAHLVHAPSGQDVAMTVGKLLRVVTVVAIGTADLNSANASVMALSNCVGVPTMPRCFTLRPP
jgi:hypothetical protein